MEIKNKSTCYLNALVYYLHMDSAMTSDLFKFCFIVPMLEAPKSFKFCLISFSTIQVEILLSLQGIQPFFFLFNQEICHFVVNAEILGYPRC